MATLYSMEAGVDGRVTLTLIPPVTRLKCMVLSFFFWKHRCRTWLYMAPGPRMGPIDNFSLMTGRPVGRYSLWLTQLDN